MRLINTTTLELKEFFDENIPKYVILSHRWGPDEVSYEEYLAGKNRDGAGYHKILDLCTLARKGLRHPLHQYEVSLDWPMIFEWAWCDTVCVDKKSSAELSEAINSMYAWYTRASVCLVFLPDVTAHGTASDLSEMDDADIIWVEGHAAFSRRELMASVWFTRGWTAQELIAPKSVLFFDTGLRSLGWKHNDLLLGTLSEASRVTIDVLAGRRWLSRCCIAQRLSWVSRRKTAREEDMAYCLLGLCQVNMPLLYGEGLLHAFKRLQLEIIASSIDDSIFAFSSPYGGMLARDPTAFDDCSTLGEYAGYSPAPPTMVVRTQRGIEFDIPVPRGHFGLRLKDGSRWRGTMMLWSISTAEKVVYVRLGFRIERRKPYADGCVRAYRVDLGTFERERPVPKLWPREQLQRQAVAVPVSEQISVLDRARWFAQRLGKPATIKVAVPLSYDRLSH